MKYDTIAEQTFTAPIGCVSYIVWFNYSPQIPVSKSKQIIQKCKRIGFVNNLTIKHCDRTKVKTIMVKNSKKLSKNFKKRRRFDVHSTSFSSQNE